MQLPLLRLSQAQLNLLEACPRRFQYAYLEQLGSLTTPEQQERLTWGSQFHLLMQQWDLGLPVEQLISGDVELQRSFYALLEAAPDIFRSHSEMAFRHSEHRRTLEFQGCLLTVVYDLLLLKPEVAQILDWKTYPRPQDRHRLGQNWQTRLYLYVLAETSDYAPEQLSMTYWFVQLQGTQAAQPEQLTFTYDTAQHQQTHEDLSRLVSQFAAEVAQYESNLYSDLRQVDGASGLCITCPFQVRCDRDIDPSQVEKALFNLAAIEEVAL